MSENRQYTVNLADLITLATFLKELDLHYHHFKALLNDGRVEGLIEIDRKKFIDRTRVNLSYHHNGRKFQQWVANGGRHTAQAKKNNPCVNESNECALQALSKYFQNTPPPIEMGMARKFRDESIPD